MAEHERIDFTPEENAFLARVETTRPGELTFDSAVGQPALNKRIRNYAQDLGYSVREAKRLAARLAEKLCPDKLELAQKK